MLALLAVALQSETRAIDISRVFTAGERMSYAVTADLHSEIRGPNSPTFIPEEARYSYTFTKTVQRMLYDGIAEVRYRRPAMTFVAGDTSETAARAEKIRETNWDFLLRVTPINEFVGLRDMTPKPPARRGGGSQARGLMGVPFAQDGLRLLPFVGQFIGELRQLAIFVGPLDNGLDFAPKLPLDPVKPGDTWRRTVGFQPQRLSAAGDDMAVQRVDFVYTYEGVKKVDGRDIHRVTATLKVDSDAAQYVNSLLGMSAEQTGLKAALLKIDGKLTFDLDLKTRRTLSARATTEGSVKLEVTEIEAPVYEERFKGETILRPQSSDRQR